MKTTLLLLLATLPTLSSAFVDDWVENVADPLLTILEDLTLDCTEGIKSHESFVSCVDTSCQAAIGDIAVGEATVSLTSEICADLVFGAAKSDIGQVDKFLVELDETIPQEMIDEINACNISTVDLPFGKFKRCAIDAVNALKKTNVLNGRQASLVKLSLKQNARSIRKALR